MAKRITFKKAKGWEQYICCFLRYKILKAQELMYDDKQRYHVNQFILALANSYCNCHILFIYHALYFPLCTSRLYFPCSLSILLIAFESRCYPNKRFILFRKRLTIGQLNVQVATAEIEEQYNLSNIIYIAFQNYYFF